MWIEQTAEETRRAHEAAKEQMRKMFEEEKKKAEARDGWVKAHTCPHCGQCPPLPPWLIG